MVDESEADDTAAVANNASRRSPIVRMLPDNKTITAESASIFGAKTNYRDLIGQLNGVDFAAIYLSTDTEHGARILRQLRELGLRQPVLGSDILNYGPLAQLAGPAGDRTVVPTVYAPGGNTASKRRFERWWLLPGVTVPFLLARFQEVLEKDEDAADAPAEEEVNAPAVAETDGGTTGDSGETAPATADLPQQGDAAASGGEPPTDAHASGGAANADRLGLAALTSGRLSIIERHQIWLEFAATLAAGGLWGTLAPALFGSDGFLLVQSIDRILPQLQGLGAALALAIVAGRLMAWPASHIALLRTKP